VDFYSQRDVERWEYVWGNRSPYQEYTFLEFNENQSLYYEPGERVNDQYSNYSSRQDEYFIYRNLKDNQTYDVIKMLRKVYVVQDSIYNQNWKILNDMKEIAGHICMSASYRDTIKHNDIIAWFALDIPVPVGPERFGGLPGLIMEINVNNGAMLISANKVEFFDEIKDIEMPKHKRRVSFISEKEHDNIIYNHVQKMREEEEPYFHGLRY
jgi:GLPGLI family protein